ncbi:MYXO-CTERM sorting domain-containing protein [Vitiosangium sp. GDMCC 1.1324]|uniref:MYXO-CTERM sorting domain-containing protein n=1 Tax=Vitiosangium sp. (strain GDMCC 1.1324) TaxID=2138576 RepID=UPI0018EE6AAD|nr:MYXO-CTERM sorting domain-containing protein [Vitiosangium sp. GDMCC 1.1324]
MECHETEYIDGLESSARTWRAWLDEKRAPGRAPAGGLGSGAYLKRVVNEHDILPSDLGPARVDQEKPSNPVFGGSVMINARGDITFSAGLAPPDNDQEEWGTAIYVAQSSFEPPGGEDGGVVTDGGTESDGGVVLDGGAAPDGGTEPDGGVWLDGGTEFDGGTEPDGGVVLDGGAAPDGGTEPDSGVWLDGGTEIDSGVALDGGGDPGAGSGSDGGVVPDGGASGLDAGSGQDAGSKDPTLVDPRTPDSGCGCQSTSPAALWSWAILGLMGLARHWRGWRREGAARD